jgi:hypothetical protein
MSIEQQIICGLVNLHLQCRFQCERRSWGFLALCSLCYFLPDSFADKETLSDALDSTLRSSIASPVAEAFANAVSSSYSSPVTFPVPSSICSANCSTHDSSYGVANG